MSQPKPGHNIKENAFFELHDDHIDLVCSCGNVLKEAKAIQLKEALNIIAEHNQKYVPTGMRL